MRSLKFRLIGLWGLSLLSAVVLGLSLVSLYRQSNEAQVGRAQAVVAGACELIRDRYTFFVAGWPGPANGSFDAATMRQLVAVVVVALGQQAGVEGGLWDRRAGSLAYAFPTYEGTGPKTDLPTAEAEQIALLNAEAARDERIVTRTVSARSQTLTLAACPVGGPAEGVTAWTMARVQMAPGLQPLRYGLLTLLALLLIMAAWLGRTLLVWRRHVNGIESALVSAGSAGMPAILRSGERELDRIVDALNLAGRRVDDARRESEALAVRVARAERLAALGRIAAGVAHEIRNPIAAARLQGENALAGDDLRRRIGIVDMLAELNRLDGLVSELLAMSQRVEPQPTRVDLPQFLEDTMARHRHILAERGLHGSVSCEPGSAVLDAAVVGRILDNLLTNAVRHAAPNGHVTLTARRQDRTLTLAVHDDGTGVPPDLVDRVFEPFVTGRADGTGLGLAIARELADAHGGRLTLCAPGGGAQATTFALDLPQED
ncbi:MAG: sensor histidine kinase [Janthinobacterium lividum]